MAADQAAPTNYVVTGLKPIQASPKYLHSNSTSHTWPFSAIAELIDNAYDASASELCIDTRVLKNVETLSFKDNGNGMSNDEINKMFRLGNCEKVDVGKVRPIGFYGMGFKSSSMRLGRDALVFTCCTESMSVGFLSQTYLEAIEADTAGYHIVTWDLPSITSPEMDSSLKAILKHSALFQTKDQLLTELEALKNMRTGTNIIIYNLKKIDKSDNLELDFTKPFDIRIRETPVKVKVNRFIPKYKRSLREYCSILYHKPLININLRGEEVETKLISKLLSQKTRKYYKPSQLPKVRLTFGFSKNPSDPDSYGLMMYYKNRLIQAYKKIGCQTKADGVGVVGVVDVDFLEPTHNKQDFMRNDRYVNLMDTAARRLNAFYEQKKHGQQSTSDKRKSDVVDTGSSGASKVMKTNTDSEVIASTSREDDDNLDDSEEDLLTAGDSDSTTSTSSESPNNTPRKVQTPVDKVTGLVGTRSQKASSSSGQQSTSDKRKSDVVDTGSSGASKVMKTNTDSEVIASTSREDDDNLDDSEEDLLTAGDSDSTTSTSSESPNNTPRKVQTPVDKVTGLVRTRSQKASSSSGQQSTSDKRKSDVVDTGSSGASKVMKTNTDSEVIASTSREDDDNLDDSEEDLLTAGDSDSTTSTSSESPNNTPRKVQTPVDKVTGLVRTRSQKASSSRYYGFEECESETNGWQRVDNECGGEHAEKIMIEEIKKVIKQLPTTRRKSLKKLYLKMYLSWSPCSDDGHMCADKLINFKNEMKVDGINVEMAIHIANFFYYKKCKERLQKMYVKGIKLEVLNGAEDWKSFLEDACIVDEAKEKCLEIAKRPARLCRESENVQMLRDIKNK